MTEKNKPGATGNQPPGTQAEPSGPPAPDPKASGADVLSLEDARKARAQGSQEATRAAKDRISEIKTVCELSGCIERFAEFADSELSAKEVGGKILEDRARHAGTEVSGHVDLNAGHESPPEIDYVAVYDRWNGKGA